MREDSYIFVRSVSLGKKKIRNCNFKNRCVLERKSMAAYSTMSVFHSKCGKGWDREFIGISQAAWISDVP